MEKIAKEIPLKEYKRAFREVVKKEEKRWFLIHLAVYVVINSMLIAINFIYSPEEIWFFYPLICWGIGLSIHYLLSVCLLEKILKEEEAKAERMAREMKK